MYPEILAENKLIKELKNHIQSNLELENQNYN